METTNLLLPSTRVAGANEWKREAEDDSTHHGADTQTLTIIEANTTEVTLEHLRNDCIIPTFAKDNEVCISHPSFIESVYEANQRLLSRGNDLQPGDKNLPYCQRTYPEAINKEWISCWNLTRL